MNVVEINNLAFGYSKRNPVFANLNLTIKQGHIYGLLGPNGAGKTTLLKLMTGTLFPRKGTVHLWGKNAGERLAETLRKTYFLQEEFAFPNWSFTRIAQLHGQFYPDFSFERFRKALERLGNVPDKPMHKLSRGMKQKVALAIALATQSEFLIMDEPFRGLDVPSRHELRRLIIEHFDTSKTMIISTHELREVNNLLDHVIFIWEGKVLLSSSINQLASMVSIGFSSHKPTDALYSEEVGGQWKAVFPKGNSQQEVDLEFLFVAITRSRALREFINNHQIQES